MNGPARAVSEGRPEPLGVTLEGNGVNVAVASRHAASIMLCLFERGGEGPPVETARIALPARTGDVFHGHVAGVEAGQLYGLRADGPFEPRLGHRFNPAKLLIDPYATRLDRPVALDPAQFSHRPGDPDADLWRDDRDSAPVVPCAVVEEPWRPAQDRRPRRPWDRTVLYELHPKGFTALNPDVPQQQRGTFAGLGHPSAVGYLKDLGVTTVELMPAMAWVDERHLPPLGLSNAWGYNPIAFLAPDPRLAPGGWDEVRDAVAAMHEAGIEVILDVVLNHAGEADELGPTLSLRGLDNATYYRLRPDDPRFFVNDTGCGNTLALDRPEVLRLAMDSLRTWAGRAGLDGFRFDLAATMGRRDTGFDPAAPLLQAIAQDPLLRELKLVAEPWDIGPGGYQTGNFPAPWGEWNDRYRDDVRRFWRGDGGMVGALATRLAGSQDLFHAKRRPSRSVNFVIAHDGFTLADLVSYDRKHNEANGEQNRDGTDANQSWNHGVEGASDDPALAARRARDQQALLATLLLSRGTPMLSMGMEAGRTQDGNNNAYAQDNRLNWLDWSRLDREILASARRLTALRAAHPALHADRFLTGEAHDGTWPDVAWLTARGEPMRQGDWDDQAARTLVMVLCAPAAHGPDRVAVALHRGWDPQALALPPASPGRAWALAFDSARGGEGEDGLIEAGAPLVMSPRSVVLLVEESLPEAARAMPAGTAELDRLAQAAGIAPSWWDETGGFHPVSDDSKRALLAAMGLPAATRGEVADALAGLSETRVLRPLPQTLVAREGEAIRLPLPAEGRAAWPDLLLTLEDGTTRIVRPDPGRAGRDLVTAPDGRAVSRAVMRLPPCPAGVHQVSFADRPELACRLVVSPGACTWPTPLAGGRRTFGLGAHLYALRRADDQGVGDFTTLATLAREAARLGAATVGLNPLHALFPGERERASPYHPSDRRFVDPLYLDLAALGDADPLGKAQADLAALDPVRAELENRRSIDYSGVCVLKDAILEEVFKGFDALCRAQPDHPAVRAFEAFRHGRGDTLTRFARFSALAESHPGPFWLWPDALRRPDHPEARRQATPARERYHAWLQWLCDRQLGDAARAAREAGLPLGFYGDIAVGAAPDSAEVWSSPDLFARGASIGAPPDLFSSEGQVWNLPPPIPLQQEASAGDAFAELVAASMRHAGLLRIDHVMGLTRLFWVPDGARGADGAYVAAPLDLLLARLAIESRRFGVGVVGEDLGTVPDGLRERLDAADVLSYRVLWFEREGEGFRPPRTWPVKAAACVSTHDLPTLAGWWEGRDIAERAALGHFTPEAAASAREARAREKSVLLETLRAAGLLERAETGAGAEFLPASVAVAVHAFVAEAPSSLMLAQVDDLVGETDAVNLPGTDRERPNWRRRLARPVGELASDPLVRRILQAVAAARG
ncbi:MAG: glycogen debranching protein GlgX [Alsobacter sp.]